MGGRLELNDLELHPDSDYLKFLQHCEIKSTPQIMMIYYLKEGYKCFICRDHVLQDPSDKYSFTDDFTIYKQHFIAEHKNHDYFLHTESFNHAIELYWNSSTILGLLDQLLVLENYLARIKRYRGNIDKEIRFHNYANIGNTIIKIMKEWQIPINMIIKYCDISSTKIGKFTNAAYLNMKEEERPQWMKNFL